MMEFTVNSEMNPGITILGTIEEISLYIVKLISDLHQDTGTSGHISVALPGGSTPKKIFGYISSHLRSHLNWNTILFFWGDERCVPPDHGESNYKMAKESLLDPLGIPSANIFRIKGEDDPIAGARRYSALMRETLVLKENIPIFDLVILGLGEDGHTASIFPGNMGLFISDKLYEATENPYTGQGRITATGKIINRAGTVVFLVTGRSKAGIVSRVIEKKEGWEDLPASMVNPENGRLIWLLDHDAASKLKQVPRS